jgi:hypothetical protein
VLKHQVVMEDNGRFGVVHSADSAEYVSDFSTSVTLAAYNMLRGDSGNKKQALLSNNNNL